MVSKDQGERAGELAQHVASRAELRTAPTRDRAGLIQELSRTAMLLDPTIDIVDVPEPTRSYLLAVMSGVRDALCALDVQRATQVENMTGAIPQHGPATPTF